MCCVVLCCVVWYGVVLRCVVWCGVVWCGIVLCCVVLCCVVYVLCDTSRHRWSSAVGHIYHTVAPRARTTHTTQPNPTQPNPTQRNATPHHTTPHHITPHHTPLVVGGHRQSAVYHTVAPRAERHEAPHKHKTPEVELAPHDTLVVRVVVREGASFSHKHKTPEVELATHDTLVVRVVGEGASFSQPAGRSECRMQYQLARLGTLVTLTDSN